MRNLSLAIYWHMHQPSYKVEGTYLMPWARLHAIKDYLDMILFLERFPNLKLNIDFVPTLLDTIIDYANGFNDIHSELSISDVNSMTGEEKSFILNNFFCPKYETMLYKSENYKKLFKKRFEKDDCDISKFSAQELSDIMALFNLVWIDPIHDKRNPRLQELWDKQHNYTQEDRIEIIDLQREIIKEIIPTYKKYLAEGRIELTASSYYHAILPILCENMKSILKTIPTDIKLPQTFDMKEYAFLQIKMAIDRIEEIFGIRPKGFWLPELCIDPKTVNMLAKQGISWTLADEKLLSNVLNFEFIRDFRGNLSEPYHLLKTYRYSARTKDIDIIFRDRAIPNLINFEYPALNSTDASNDLYNKIKTIQSKLLTSPDENHMLTIAMDGENCWENYVNDGNDFLESFYSLLENDNTIQTVLISDYLKNDKRKKVLKKIPLGSGVDNSFVFWIGDPIKNKAWKYVKDAKDMIDKCSHNKKNNEKIKYAKQELMTVQGSDWFWWYGEPNNSGQDYVFDYMFREHLKNIYSILEQEIPQHLENSLINSHEIPLKRPSQNISPKMDGSSLSDYAWNNSGAVRLLDGPIHRENKNIDKINFGCDSNNMYFRLHINKCVPEKNLIDKISQFYIYLRNATKIGTRAYVRLISKSDNLSPVLTEKFENELTLTFVKDTLYPPRLLTCTQQDTWTLANSENVRIAYDDVIDITVPFESVGVQEGETVEFIMANTDSGVKSSYFPHEIVLSLKRC
ncbi:MAG: glycoside hydrolase family 57 protein [bacterium]|nr:glycoside hydrolase family 57 protein [bacterium]